MPGAAAPFEGVDYKGDLAMPATAGKVNMATVGLFGDLGLETSNTGSAGTFSGSHTTSSLGAVNNSPSATAQNLMKLTSDLQKLTDVIAAMPTECTISPTSLGFASTNVIGNSQNMLELNMDNCDTNNDGIAVYDIESGATLTIQNFNMIFESAGRNTFGVFRIKADKLTVSNAGLLAGDGVVGNVDNACPVYNSANYPPQALDNTLAAMFVHLGESHMASFSGLKNSNNVGNLFDISNSIISGVGFFDLTPFSDPAVSPNDFKTKIKVAGTQACTQLVAPRIEASMARMNMCTLPCDTSADAVCGITKKASVFGDPYVKRWGQMPGSSRKAFEWQGACDVIVSKTVTSFGLPLMIQARTASSPAVSYSVVQEIAISHGSGDRIRITANNEVFYGPPAASESLWTPSGPGDTLKVGTHDWLTIKQLAPVQVGANTYKDLNGNHVPTTATVHSYEIALSPSSKVTISNVVDFMNIVIDGSQIDFLNSGGVLGDYQLGKPILRNGSKAAGSTLEAAYKAFVEDWVPTSAESLFFAPQSVCTYPTATARRLRGSAAVDPEFEAQAREACTGASEFELCMDDVIQTNNLAAAWIHQLV